MVAPPSKRASRIVSAPRLDPFSTLIDDLASRVAERVLAELRRAEPKTPPSGQHALVGEKAAAARLGLSVRTLQGWRASGRGPAFLKLGSRRVAYAPEALERFVSGNAEPIEGATPKANRTGGVAKRGNRAAA
jgi:hypothetical protein